MKHILIIAATSLAIGLGGCSTTPDTAGPVTTAETAQTEKTSEETVSKAEAKAEKKKDAKKEKGLTKTFNSTPEQVKTATLVAMQKVGFKIKKEDGLKIEGKRSNKVGLAVGSGGEKMRAEILPMDGGQTGVFVRTKKTFVGIVGQKNWDDEVMELITESLEGGTISQPLASL